MGTILQGTCPNCGYHAELFVGGGMRDCDPETALEIAGSHAGLADALKENGWFRIERRISICSKCRKLVAAPSVTYQQKDGQGRRITGVCPDCKGKLQVWKSKEQKHIPCPACGQPFSMNPVGNWD